MGTPITVEARFEKMFDFMASHVVMPNHFLHSNPSTTMFGISRSNIAGRVKKIMGTPASARRGVKCIGAVIPESF